MNMKVIAKSEYTFKTDVSSKDYYDFLKKCNSNFFSTEEYGVLKTEYGAEYFLVGVENNNKLVATGLLVFYKSKKIKNLYCPRGPLMNYFDSDILKTFLEGTHEFAKKLKCDTIDIEPDFIVRKYTSKLEVLEEDQSIIKCFETCGYKHQGYTGQIPNFQLRYTVKFDLSKSYAEFFNAYASDKKKTLARNDKYLHVKLVESDSSTLSDIVKFREQLSDKKRFHVEDITYFEKLYSLYEGTYQIIYLRAIINFSETISCINIELEKLMLELTTAKNKQDVENQIKSLEQKLQEINSFEIKHKVEEYCLGAGIAIIVNDNMTYLYEHTDKEIGNFGVPTLMSDYLLRYGIDNKLKSLDLLGLINPNYPDNPNKSVNNFKMTFGGDVVEYVGVFSKPVSLLYGVKKNAKKAYYRIKGRIYED